MSVWRSFVSTMVGSLLAVGLLPGGVLAASAAPAGSLCVNPGGTGGCLPSIQAAVSAAAPGATISIAAGVYKESVLVTKPLVLQGAGAASTVLDAAGQHNGIVVRGVQAGSAAQPGTVLEGLTIENAQMEGVLLADSAFVLVTHDTVQHNDQNLVLPTSPRAEPTCPGALPFEQQDCGEGIHLLGVAGATIAANTVQGNNGGILLTDETGSTHDNVIAQNQVANNRIDCGITLASHPSGIGPKGPLPGHGIYANTIEGNTSTGNGGAGIGLFTATPGTATHDNTVTGNTVTNNGTGGISMHSHAPARNLNGNVLTNNTISGNGWDPDAGIGPSGIDLLAEVLHGAAPVQQTTISGNTISQEFYGIWQAGTTATKVQGNSIDAATVPLATVNSFTSGVAGTLVGDSGGAFAYYAFNTAGTGQAQTLTVRFPTTDQGLASAIGVNLYENGARVGTVNGNNSSTPGTNSSSFKTTAPGAVLVQVYNYAAGQAVPFQVQIAP